ncbi:DUF503 family protein [Spirochaetota bacterium]
MYVLISKVTVNFDGLHSLKEKRSRLKKLKSSLFNKYKITAVESDNHNMHNVATIGFSAVSLKKAFLEKMYENILEHIEIHNQHKIISQENLIEKY